MIATPTHTLTERYLAAAAGRVPEAQRAELRQELAERIADTVDAKVEAGLSPADAEYETLSELGDPAVLTATYLDQPLHLIGPRHYLLWRRLMWLLVPLVAGLAGIGVVLANALAGKGVGSVLGGGLSAAVAGGVQVAFWVTLVFAIIERAPRWSADAGLTELAGPDGLGWKPERLPQATEREREVRVDQLVDIAVLAVVGVLVFLADRIAFFRVDGEWERVPVFVPETWEWLRWAWVAIIVAQIGLALFALVRRRRTWTYVALHLVLGIAFAAVTLPPLLAGELVNPAVFEATGWGTGPRHFAPGGTGTTVAAVAVVLIAFSDTVEAFVATVLDRRRVLPTR